MRPEAHARQCVRPDVGAQACTPSQCVDFTGHCAAAYATPAFEDRERAQVHAWIDALIGLVEPEAIAERAAAYEKAERGQVMGARR